jgi:phosphonate transport system substrate-binding protein
MLWAGIAAGCSRNGASLGPLNFVACCDTCVVAFRQDFTAQRTPLEVLDMSSTDSVAGSSPNKGIKPLHLLALVVVVVAATAGITTALWFYHFQVPDQPDSGHNLAMTGFRLAKSHKLDAKFTDADANLVADPPTDPSQFVDPPTLRFAFIEEEDVEKQKKAWQPFMEYLSKATGKPVEYQMLVGETDMLKAMRDGKLDVAGFNTGSVPSAVNLCGFTPVCAVPTAQGSALTRTEIIVAPDSPLKSAADLKGHELTLTEPNSNSGYKAPLVLLHSDFGLVPLTDISLRFSGSHEASIEGIASRTYEAAAVAEDMLSRESAAGKIKSDQYRVIYSSEPFPTAGLGYVYNLKPELAAKIKDALLSFDWKGTPLEDIFNGAQQTKFVPVDYKNDWPLIRRIDDQMGTEPTIEQAAPSTQKSP